VEEENSKSSNSKKPNKEKPEKIDIMALISYIGPLCLIPLLSQEEDEFVKFHAKQGLILLIGEVATWIVLSFIPLLWRAGNFINLAWLALSIQGIINVINGKRKEIALIGQYAKKIDINF